MSARRRAILRTFGGLLSLSCIAYIIWRFLSTNAAQQLIQAGTSSTLVWHVLVAAIVYACGLVWLTISWWWVVSAFVTPVPNFLPVSASYATSQFAKYLPGNVGQYVARHAMLRRLHLPHGALLAALAAEAASLVAAALIWAIPTAHDFLERVLSVPAWGLPVIVILAILLLLGALYWLTRRAFVQRWVHLLRPVRLLGVLGMHVVFFGLMILALIVVATAIPDAAASPWRLAGVATTSWLAGFVVVGSPGGLGVREAVFVELLSGSVPEPTALLLAAAFRVITFLGDLILLLLGLLAFARLRRHAANPASRAA